MNTIADIVIGTIRAQICGKPYHIAEEITDDVLNETYTFSRAQDMAHLVAAELLSQQAIQNAEMKGLFKKQQILAVYRYERMNHEFIDICRVLEENGIPYMPLKGSVIRQYYPEPWMRTSSDIDILVKPEDLSTATDALVSVLSYKNHGKLSHDVQLFAPSGVHVELHFDTVEEHYLAGANKILNKVWDEYAIHLSGQRYAMSNEMFYFYHIAHMAKHFQEGGCGIRFFVDLWLLNRHIQYDEAKRDDLLRKGGLLEFAYNMERLSEVWFEEQTHDDITIRIENYVLNGGVYGSSDNKTAITYTKNGGRLGYTLYLLFLPCHELTGAYPVLYKHKWLYPFCQIHRWFSLLFNRGFSRATAVLSRGAAVHEESGESVDQMLKDLNLGSTKRK